MKNGKENYNKMMTLNESTPDVSSEIEFWLESTSFNSFVEEISKRVIGQENLKVFLANIYNYLFNIVNENPINNNTILSAPSGSGKTETFRALKDYFKERIPSLMIFIQDMSRITATGYKGMEPSDLLLPFFNSNTSDDIGIVFLDEFDKKLLPSYNGMGVDTNKEAQNCLLTLVEGGIVQSKMEQTIDTSRIMFIGLGSFDEFRNKKETLPNGVGFESKLNNDIHHYDPITKEDMIEAGGLYELIGRFPIIINYSELKKKDIIRIIDKTIENIEATFNCSINISDKMMNYLISEANGKFGCRLLDSIIRQPVLMEYTKALANYKSDKKLSITIYDKENSTYRWKNLSEKEQNNKALLEAFNSLYSTELFR